MPVSPPFKVEDGALIGIDREGFAAFFLLVLSECKRGKIYRFRAEEVKSSGVQKNYYFANLDLAAQAIGLTAVSLEYHLKEVVKTWAISGEYPDFLRDEWTNQIVSLKTGEVTYEIKTFSSWTTSMLSSFIDVLEHVAKDMIDGFKMLDPKTYGITAKGEKRQLPNVNKTWKIAK
ncbi:MAG: hypothetical protein U5L45_00365 [Saprospiraceae bacterium]|nr:hypothetical protein [Saprospiraceae bacterium]